MAIEGMEFDPLDLLDEIVDYCVGNIPAQDVGAADYSTLPEALSKIGTTPGDRNASKDALDFVGKLKSKVVFLETQLLQLKRMQERGIIR